jgi:hypothetical protein
MGRIHYNSKDAYKDVVIELTKDITLDYLIHYAAPYTGSGRTTVPKGTRFQLHQHMNDYCFYAHTINSNLEKKLWQKEYEVEGKLKGRCTGISFFIHISTFLRPSTIFVKGDINALYGMCTELNDDIYAVDGDVFSNFLCVDGRALFIPAGLTSIRSTAVSYMKTHRHTLVHYVPNSHQTIYTSTELKTLVFDALDSLYAQGARRIAMNGIRTTAGSGKSEELQIAAVMEWIYRRRIPRNQVTIVLVDIRGGFSKCNKYTAFGHFEKCCGIKFYEIYNECSPFLDILTK